MPELTFVVAPEFVPETIQRVQIEDHVPLVEERVTVRALPVRATHVASSDGTWDWRQLRDYVVGEIVKVTGQFPRNEAKEAGIFKSFLDRWGSDAAPIARYAFENMHGHWKGAPVSVSRFCKGSDPYFGQLIVDHLNRNVR